MSDRSGAPGRDHEGGGSARWWGGAWLGAWALALTQPVLALLENNPLLVTDSGRRTEAWVILALLVIGAPLLLFAIDFALRSWPAVSTGFRSIGLTALFGLAAARWLAEAGVAERTVALLGGLAIGVGIVVVLFRSEPARTFATLLALVVPLALIGLFRSDTGTLLRSEGSTPVVAETASATENDDRPPIVMLIVDELPTRTVMTAEGKLDAEHFPNLARFGEQSTWYRHFTAVAPFTQQVVPSMLTGVDPVSDDGVWVNYPDTLFTLLAPEYHLVAGESVTKLCGLPVCEPWPPLPPGEEEAAVPATSTSPSLRRSLSDLWWQGLAAVDASEAILDDFVEEVAPAPTMPTEINQEGVNFGRYLMTQPSEQPLRLTEFMSSFRASAIPTLYFFHMVLPHHPFLFDSEGVRYETATGDAEPFTPANEAVHLGRVSERRHLEQAQYVDGLLGEVFAQLDEKGIFDDAFIVLAADHGLDFAPGDHHREYSEAGAPGIAYAPLFIKAPGQTEGVIDDSNVLSYDLLPTIAAAADIVVPWETVGVAVDDPARFDRGDTKPFFVFQDAYAPELLGIETFSDRQMFDQLLTLPARVRSGESGVAPAIAELLGQPFEPAGAAGVDATVPTLEQWQSIEHPPVGVVSGWIDASTEQAPGSAIVVAIADQIVGVAPLEQFRGWGRHFAVDLLPISDQPLGELRVGLVDDSGVVRELDLRSG